MDTEREMDIEIEGYKLVCTSTACPEQYQVFDKDGAQVAYLRARWGVFSCEHPGFGEALVYLSHIKGYGMFENSEREHQLKGAISSLNELLKEEEY